MSYLTRWQRPEVANWPVVGRLTDLRADIDRLFETPWTEFARASRLLSGWTPALDIYEDKENVFVKAELPGMKKEEIQVVLHDGTLSISGERKSESNHKEAEVYHGERFVGKFQRAISMPTPVAADKVKADYKDGTLTVTLPKTEEAKPKQIDVNIS